MEENLIYEDYDGKNPHVHNYYSSIEIANRIYNENYPYMKAEVVYNIEELYRAGFISSSSKPKLDAQGNITYLKINDITWAGHNLLNNIRDEKIWNVVKANVTKIGKTVSLKALVTAATTVVEEGIKNPSFIKGIMDMFK